MFWFLILSNSMSRSCANMLFNSCLFITFFMYYFQSVEGNLNLVNPCIPTATVQGPCHNCVCTVEGVFHCYPTQCEQDKQVSDQQGDEKYPEKDCESGVIYREDTTFCTCSERGYWQSETCQKKFAHLHSINNYIALPSRTNILCSSAGNFYRIDCNICRCENNTLLNLKTCATRNCIEGHKADTCKFGEYLHTGNEICVCSDINFYIDRLCLSVNETFQEIKTNDISKLIGINNSTWTSVAKLLANECVAEELYLFDCNSCNCIEGRLVCTQKACHLTEKNALRNTESIDGEVNAFDLLPAVESLSEKCTPGNRYRYKCNLCHCSDKGVLKCATIMCLEEYVLDTEALKETSRLKII